MVGTTWEQAEGLSYYGGTIGSNSYDIILENGNRGEFENRTDTERTNIAF